MYNRISTENKIKNKKHTDIKNYTKEKNKKYMKKYKNNINKNKDW